MSKPGLSFGLNLKKKSSTSKPPPAKRKPATFGSADDSDEDVQQTGDAGSKVEVITEIDGLAPEADAPTLPQESKSKSGNSKAKGATTKPPTLKQALSPSAQFGNLSESLSTRRHAEADKSLDASIYDYDAVYDSFKPQKKTAATGGGSGGAEEAERRPRYMNRLAAAAEVRDRDRLIAEQRRLAREREAEGDEFADKEEFVTEAYKKQQAENQRIDEEERRREEQEAKNNKGKGMAGFYKDLLERQDREHAEKMRAAEEAKNPTPPQQQQKEGNGERAGAKGEKQEDEKKEKTEADIAREVIAKGGKITVNEDGQVVDKRQLLQGGLNVGARKKAEAEKDRARLAARSARDQGRGVYASGGKQAMRERQSRMLEAQLEENLKRAREEEEEEKKKTELASKSRKTTADISSAKERYLARKRAAEEAKKQGQVEEP